MNLSPHSYIGYYDGGTSWGLYTAGNVRLTWFPNCTLKTDGNGTVTCGSDNTGSMDCASCDDRFVNAAGDTMTGILTMNANIVMNGNNVRDANTVQANIILDNDDANLNINDNVIISGDLVANNNVWGAQTQVTNFNLDAELVCPAGTYLTGLIRRDVGGSAPEVYGIFCREL